MWNIRRVFALSAFAAASAFAPPALARQDPAEFNFGPGGFRFGQDGAFGIPMPNDGFGAFPMSLLNGPALGPNPPGGLLMLINLPAVQQELKLTDTQKLKLKELKEDQARKEMEGDDQAIGNEPAPGQGNAPRANPPAGKSAAGKRAAAAPAARGKARGQARQQPQGDGNPGNGQDPNQGGFGQGGFGPGDGFDPAAMAAAIGPRLEKAEAEMLKVLEPAQRDRLQEIGLQHEGVKAVARPEVARKLNLTNAQSNQVQMIASQLQAGQFEVMEQHRDEFLERLGADSPTQVDPRIVQDVVKRAEQANQGLVKRAEVAINRVLKPAQKEAFQKLQGEPFDLKSALAGKPLRRKPGNNERADAEPRANRPAEAEANAPAPTPPPPAEAPRPAGKLQVPRAKDAGKRPSAIKQP
ncbi:MAG: hypothetical protein U0800_25725 [Isosphaeraceae bacterium]